MTYRAALGRVLRAVMAALWLMLAFAASPALSCDIGPSPSMASAGASDHCHGMPQHHTGHPARGCLCPAACCAAMLAAEFATSPLEPASLQPASRLALRSDGLAIAPLFEPPRLSV